MSEPLLLPAQAAFRELGIGRDYGYELIRSGRLRALRIGGRRLLVPRQELTDFITRELKGGDPLNDTASGNGRGPHLDAARGGPEHDRLESR